MPPGIEGLSVSLRWARAIAFVVAACTVAVVFAVDATATRAASTPIVTSAWQAKVGASGANGTANISAVTNGAGSIGLKLVRLRASATLPVVIVSGTCTSPGASLFSLASIKTSSSGAVSRTSALTAAQVAKVLATASGSGRMALRIGSGSSAKCGSFTVRAVSGPQAVVQGFYRWYLTDQNYNHLLARPDLTPAFVNWLKAFSWDYNPIVCAQDVPDSVSAGSVAISGSSANVTTTLVFDGFPPAELAVNLALGPTGWRISAIQCPA
jgi:hypothetical protein